MKHMQNFAGWAFSRNSFLTRLLSHTLCVTFLTLRFVSKVGMVFALLSSQSSALIRCATVLCKL